MLKKLATILMTGALFLAPFQTVNATPNYFVTLNGVRQNVTPIVQDGTTLLPVATVGKLIGYQATWDNKTKSGTLENESNKVKFKLGSYTLTMVGKDEDDDIAMPQPVKVINGKTYLPLRVVGETLGMNVGYNGSTGEISLQTSSYVSNTNATANTSKKIDYDNLTLDEWKKLSDEEFNNATDEQLMKALEKYFDSLSDEEQPKEDTEQPKEEEKPSAPEPKTEEKIEYSDEEIIEETLRLVNEERERLGLNPLIMKQEYNDFAKWKANYLVDHNLFKHIINGKTIDTQLKEQGVTNFQYGGENLTGMTPNHRTLNHPFKNWMNSPRHKENMLSSIYNSIGIAISDTCMDYEGSPMKIVVMVLIKN